MTLGNLFIVNAVISLVFGAASVLTPALLMSFYDVTLSSPGILVARLLGATFLGISVLTWFARNAEDSEARQAIIPSLFVENVIGFVVALLGQLAGLANPFGWLIVALCLLLALGYGYFQFLKPTGSQPNSFAQQSQRSCFLQHRPKREETTTAPSRVRMEGAPPYCLR